MKCKPKKYANGGPVRVFADGGLAGKPTYLKSVAAKVGVGDGYDYFPKKSPEPKKIKAERIYKDARTGEVSKTPPRRMDVSNAASEFGNVVAKRKKALDEL